MIHWMKQSLLFSASVCASNLAFWASSMLSSLLSKRWMRLVDALATMMSISPSGAGLDHALQVWGLRFCVLCASPSPASFQPLLYASDALREC